MSEHTPYQLTVLDCPEAEREAVVGIINEYGLTPEWMGGPSIEELHLGLQYTDDSASFGIAPDLAALLIERAPGATWYGWADPVDVWLGDLTMYTPTLGLFSNACDADGNAVFTADAVRKAVEEATSIGSFGVPVLDPDALARALGTPWEDAVRALVNGVRKEEVPA